MGTTHLDPHGNFSNGQVAAVTLLFDSLIARDMAPIVFFAIDSSGRACAIFNGAFSKADADSIGELIVNQLEVIADNLPD